MDVGKQTSVLIVEDDVVSRTALDMLLTASGYQTRAVASAEEALRIAQSEPAPMVAVIDVDLPGMSGLDLLERLERERIAVPAVLVTATTRESIDAWIERGVPHVRKPVDFRYLLSVLSEQAPSHDG
jgi:CheY-like chemotaxis protein